MSVSEGDPKGAGARTRRSLHVGCEELEFDIEGCRSHGRVRSKKWHDRF